MEFDQDNRVYTPVLEKQAVGLPAGQAVSLAIRNVAGGVVGRRSLYCTCPEARVTQPSLFTSHLQGRTSATRLHTLLSSALTHAAQGCFMELPRPRNGQDSPCVAMPSSSHLEQTPGGDAEDEEETPNRGTEAEEHS